MSARGTPEWLSPGVGTLAHVVYASAESNPLGRDELVGILEQARVANAAREITGILLYAEGSFFQVLEGEADAVDETFARIARDPRHADIVVVVREPIHHRSFPDWSMGFASLTGAEVDELVGASGEILRPAAFAHVTPGRARKLIEAFARGRWRTSGLTAA